MFEDEMKLVKEKTFTADYVKEFNTSKAFTKIEGIGV